MSDMKKKKTEFMCQNVINIIKYLLFVLKQLVKWKQKEDTCPNEVSLKIICLNITN